eukprot:TRINITY_DN2922_c0_g2_i1.p2 TRINITY_DN2922_c0_g2~~TRINITY_DN2922_c0_g2_i1.p2  ORF type:complete len:194 (+),score=45.81 TRINITY_DN2922_c0_g2_i1:45-626(+)
MQVARGPLLRWLHAGCARRVPARLCTQHVSREVKFGDGTFKFSGPPGMFDAMSEEDFYKNEHFHQFWADLGLELFKAEGSASTTSDVHDCTPGSSAASEAPAEPSPAPTPAKAPQDELPPMHPGITEGLQLEIEAGAAVWKVKKSVQEQTGVPEAEFDLYVGKALCEDHKTLYHYMQASTQENLEISIRQKAP